MDVSKLFFKIWYHNEDLLEELLNLTFEGVIWSINESSKILHNTSNVLRIKQILNLPGIRNLWRLDRKWYNNTFSFIFEEWRQLKTFVQNLINQHKDFFEPLFKTFNVEIEAIKNTVGAFKEGNNILSMYRLINFNKHCINIINKLTWID